MLIPEHFGFTDEMQKQLPSKSTDTYALGMTILEVLTGKPPYNNIPNSYAIVLKLLEGTKPNRPPSGFSDKLWNLLLNVWDPEYGSQLPKRPSIPSILDQINEDADNWDPSTIPLHTLRVEEETLT